MKRRKSDAHFDTFDIFIGQSMQITSRHNFIEPVTWSYLVTSILLWKQRKVATCSNWSSKVLSGDDVGTECGLIWLYLKLNPHSCVWQLMAKN